MAFVDENKGEPHLVGLNKKGREMLKAYALSRVYTNDNKEVTAHMVRETVESLIDGLPNLIDDNIDLRAYTSEVFQLADCIYDNVTQIYTFAMAEVAKNANDDSQFYIEGMVQAYGIDYLIIEDALIFSIDDELEDTDLLELEIKYRYFV
jgi:hypothetical protein